MIEKLFVPADICLLAREKGFKEPVLGYWVERDGKYHLYQIEGRYPSRKEYIAAPTWDQLDEWLVRQRGYNTNAPGYWEYKTLEMKERLNEIELLSV